MILDKTASEQLREIVLKHLRHSGESTATFRLRVANAIQDFAKISTTINPDLLSAWISSEDSFTNPLEVDLSAKCIRIKHRISEHTSVVTVIGESSVNMSLVTGITTNFERTTPHNDSSGEFGEMLPVVVGFYKLMTDNIVNGETKVNSLNAYSSLAPCPQDDALIEEQGVRGIPECSEELSIVAGDAIHHMDRFQELYERFQRGIKEPTDMTLAEFNETYKELVKLHAKMNPELLLKALIS